MTSQCDRNRGNEEEEVDDEEDEEELASRTGAEDNLSNSDGPLLLVKHHQQHREVDAVYGRSQVHTSTMLVHQSNWHKTCESETYYSPEDEKKGNRGIWMLAGILTFIGVCNLGLNLAIMLVLRVGQGMEAMEVVPERNLVKFYGNTDLDRVCLQKGLYEGFGDEPVQLIGNGGGVQIRVSDRYTTASSSVRVLENGTSIQVESFQVKDSRSGSILFSTDYPSFSLPKSIERIEANVAQTHRIAAPKKSDLTLQSNKRVFLDGAEGVVADSKTINWTARNDILLHSKNGDIVVDAYEGINFPRVPLALTSGFSEVKEQYKVCVCMPDGKLFAVPTRNLAVNCARVSRSMKYNPCA